MGHHHVYLLIVVMMKKINLAIAAAILLPLHVWGDAPVSGSSHTAAPTGKATTPAVKQVKEGELDVSITGERKDKLVVGKLDPPAAFNLEDIQNFPEDRLHPVLSNPITFEE